MLGAGVLLVDWSKRRDGVYYFRFKMRSNDTLNLLYQPEGSSPDQITQAFEALAGVLGREHGAVWWFCEERHALILLRSRDVASCSIYQYDHEAPYDGLYVHHDLAGCLG